MIRALSLQSWPPIGIIDFYGLRTISEKQARQALGIKEGDAWSGVPEAALRRLKALPGVQDAHIEPVCCEDGKTILYVGLRERGTPPQRFRPAPRGNLRLPADILAAGQAFERALEESARRGETREDQSEGHALAHDPAVRAVQERFVVFAARHRSLLRDVLRRSANSGDRALAAQVLAYASDKQAAADDLADALRDPDEGVRNNATRALLVMAASGRRIRISAQPFIEMLDSLVWSDRNKASGALFALTMRRDPATLSQLKKRALPALIEMARWKSPGHAQPAFVLLGRIGGLTEAEIFRAWNAGDRQAVIEAARAGDHSSRRQHP